MAAQKGRLYLLKLGASGAGGTVAGLRNLTATINNEMVDITNKDSAGFRNLLEGAGTASVTVTADGIASDGATYETLKGYAQANTHNTFQIIGPDNDALEGVFGIASFNEAGAFNNEMTFSITLESAGTVSFTQV